MGTAKTEVLKNPNNDYLMYEASLSCSPTRKTYVSEGNENSLPPEQTVIVDSGATHLYIAQNAPHGQLDTTTSKIRVGTINVQVEISTAKTTLPIPQLAADFPTTGYIMPTFTNTLIGVGPICDANCTIVSRKEDVKVISPEGKPILQGWREKKIPRLWRFALRPNGRGEKNTQQQARKDRKHIVYTTYPSWRH